MSVALAAAMTISVVALLLLCFANPKRRRSRGGLRLAAGSMVLRLLCLLVILPGVLLAMSGDPAAFLIWLGGCCVMGWLIALAFRERHTGHARDGGN
jgi:threonine/homoserine/homoserine lactone efflux protein